jgi:hypothetical protein
LLLGRSYRIQHRSRGAWWIVDIGICKPRHELPDEALEHNNLVTKSLEFLLRRGEAAAASRRAESTAHMAYRT